MNWNKIDEGTMPDEGQIVLVGYLEHVGCAMFRNGAFAALGLFIMTIGDPIARATHWMALPKGPEAEVSVEIEDAVVEASPEIA